jgi:RNA polymerase sigma factor (sigma-70 family)
LAEIYAKQISNTSIDESKIPNIELHILEKYDVLLDEEEEKEFGNLLKSLDSQKISNFLFNLELMYREYFLEQVSERRASVEIVYQDVTERTKLKIEDEEITDIKKAESQNDYLLAWKVCKQIKYHETKSINQLYAETNQAVNHYVVNHSGNEEDSEETWCISFNEFRRKLMKKPKESGFYEWRPVELEKQKPAKVSTYFIGICFRRWLDELRRRKYIMVKEPPIFEPIDLNFSEDGINDFYERQDLRYRLKIAIHQLSATCQKIIEGRWFGGSFGDGLETKELSKEINLAVGSINNKYTRCFDQLREIMLHSLN